MVPMGNRRYGSEGNRERELVRYSTQTFILTDTYLSIHIHPIPASTL